jgi:hypothetical protein
MPGKSDTLTFSYVDHGKFESFLAGRKQYRSLCRRAGKAQLALDFGTIYINSSYFSPNIFRVIKSRRMRWAGHKTCMGWGEVHTEFWFGNLRERDRLEDPGVDGVIILRWIFRKWDVGVRTGLIWLRIDR